MSTSPLFSPLAPMIPAPQTPSFQASYAGGRATLPGPVVVRRRPKQVEGQALEILGHAIEYLVDSRMVNPGGNRMEYNREAVEILSRSSREIFDGCQAVVPFGDRLKQWLYGQDRKAA